MLSKKVETEHESGQKSEMTSKSTMKYEKSKVHDAKTAFKMLTNITFFL